MLLTEHYRSRDEIYSSLAECSMALNGEETETMPMANLSNAILRETTDPERTYEALLHTSEVLVLTPPGQEQLVYKYVDGQRTEEITGKRITVHYMGVGEADVKLPPSYQSTVDELDYARLVKPKAYQIDRKIYISADAIEKLKQG